MIFFNIVEFNIFIQSIYENRIQIRVLQVSESGTGWEMKIKLQIIKMDLKNSKIVIKMKED